MDLEKSEEPGPTTSEWRLPGGRRLFFSQTQVLGDTAHSPGCCVAIERSQEERGEQEGRIFATFQEVKETSNNTSLARQHGSFPLVPFRNSSTSNATHTYVIERLPSGTFDKDDLGGAGGHGNGVTGRGAGQIILPGKYPTKREKFKGDETEESYRQEVPAVFEAMSAWITEKNMQSKYAPNSVEELVGCLFEFFVSNESSEYHDVTAFRNCGVHAACGPWLNWAHEVLSGVHEEEEEEYDEDDW